MRLHSCGVLGLRQDLQHLIIGEEEEPWEVESLLPKVHVGIHPLQDAFQQLAGALQLLKHACMEVATKTLGLQTVCLLMSFQFYITGCPRRRGLVPGTATGLESAQMGV